MKKIFSICLSILLAGCINAGVKDKDNYPISDGHGYHWSKEPMRQGKKQIEYTYNYSKEIFKKYFCYRNADGACLDVFPDAVSLVVPGYPICQIITWHSEQDLIPYLRWHEEHHCAGYDHLED